MIRILGHSSFVRRSYNAYLLPPLFRMRILVGVLLLCALAASATAQQYAISTVAGNGQSQPPFGTAPSPGWISGVAGDASGDRKSVV